MKQNMDHIYYKTCLSMFTKTLGSLYLDSFKHGIVNCSNNITIRARVDQLVIFGMAILAFK